MTNKIVFTLQVYFTRSDSLQFSETREVNCCAFIIEASTEICKVSKERVRTRKDYVIGREITKRDFFGRFYVISV